MTGSTTYERTISSVTNNVITISVAIPAGPSFFDGSALCLLPDREINRTAAGPCIEVNSTKNLLVDGFYLESATGANCHGVYCHKGASITVQNLAIKVEDWGIYITGAYAFVYGDSGAVSSWGAAYGYIASDVGGADLAYAAAVDFATFGFNVQVNAVMRAERSIASTGGTGYDARDLSLLYCHTSSSRYNTNGYVAQRRAYIYAANVADLAYGNTTDYNPAVTDTFGNSNASITWT
jgi:hypothetical protein